MYVNNKTSSGNKSTDKLKEKAKEKLRIVDEKAKRLRKRQSHEWKELTAYVNR